MANAATLIIKILGDAKGAKTAAKEAEGSVGKLAKGVDKLTGPAVAVAGSVAAIGIAAGKAASDAQQSMGSVESVFGRYADGVKKSSESAAQSVGLSANSYRELAAKIGGQLKNAGVPMDQLAKRTDTLIRQGSDLAATFGGSTADAVDALGAALRGEADPAERFALSLSQTRVNALLAARGQDKLKGAALAAAKAQATMDLITQQSADSTGQFAREADTAQGQQQRMTAATMDAAAALGNALLPAMTTMAAIISKVVGWMAKHTTATWIVIGVIGALALGILVLNAALTVYTAVTTLAASATVAAWAAALWPILLVVAAIAAVIAIVVLLWNKFPPFKAAVLAVWSAIQTATAAVVGWLKTAWATVWPALLAGVRAVGSFFAAVWAGVSAVVGAVAGFVMRVWAAVWPIISAGLNLLGALFRLQFAVIRLIVQVVAAVVGAVFRVAFAVVMAALRPVVAAIQAGFNMARAVVTAVAAALSGPLSAAFRVVSSVARTVGAAISAAFNAVMGPIRSVASLLSGMLAGAFRTVSGIVSGIASKLSGAFSGVAGVIHGITGAVESLISALGRIKVPSISLPHIPGITSSAAGAPVLTRRPTYSGTGAPRVGGRASSLTGASSGGSGPTIIVQALDPESAARAVNRVLQRHNQRVGLTGTLATT